MRKRISPIDEQMKESLKIAKKLIEVVEKNLTKNRITQKEREILKNKILDIILKWDHKGADLSDYALADQILALIPDTCPYPPWRT